MRALETEQHAAAPTSTNGAEDPRRAHLAPQPSTRRGAHGRWLHWAPSWMIAAIVSTGVVTALVVQLTSGTGTTAPRRPGHTLATGTAATTASLSAATARFLAAEHAADRNLGPARSQSTRAARPSRHRQPSLHTSARGASHSSEHDHIIGQRHIRSGRYRATVKPIELQLVLGLRVVRIRPRLSCDAAAHLAQLELGLKLLHPIESHPPLTRHRSRHLQLPVGRTRPTPTGR